MKKIIPLFLLTTLPAFAAVIDANTQIKWNSIVVVAALHDVGLMSDYGIHSEVATTYDRILEDLLNRDTFSVTDAVSVCMRQCNKSTFLKEGRGESGRKCPTICEDFGKALIIENNKNIDSLVVEDGDCYSPYGRVYTPDKQFYMDGFGRDAAIFESKTNRKIAEFSDEFGEDGTSQTNFDPIEFDYEGYCFSLVCRGYYHGDGCCQLDASKPEGKIYTSDNKFYVFNGCTQYIYETGTNKKIAQFEYDYENYKEICKIIDSRYNGYVCERVYNGLKVQTAAEKQREYENTYYNKWSDLQKCLAEYRKINFEEINTWLSSGVFNSAGVNELQRYYEHRDFESKFSRFTSTSYDLYNEIIDIYRSYCPAPSSERLANIRRELSDLSKYFLDIDKRFAKTQTETLEDAIWEISKGLPDYVKQIDAACCGILGNLNCTGECKKFGQDHVTCTLGKLKGIFEFDDICDGNKL